MSSVYDYYRSSLGKLLLEYIQHSGSDVVIVKIVGMLEKLKEYQKKFDAKKRNYDDELQMCKAVVFIVTLIVCFSSAVRKEASTGGPEDS